MPLQKQQGMLESKQEVKILSCLSFGRKSIKCIWSPYLLSVFTCILLIGNVKAHSAYSDEMPYSVVNDLGLHCLPWLILLVCVEVIQPSQPDGVIFSMVSLPNHIFYLPGLVL